jgi:hypothetical protein
MTDLHVVHHELVGKLAPRLGVLDFFVHEAVDDAYATKDTESYCYFFVGGCKLRSIYFVTQLGYSNNFVLVFDWDAQDVSGKEKF